MRATLSPVWRRTTQAAMVLVVLAGFSTGSVLTRAAHADTPAPVGDGVNSFHPGRSVLISRSDRENVYRNDDGSFTAQLSLSSVNFQSDDGSWQPIDNHVEPDPEVPGGFRNVANDWHVHFGSVESGVTVETDAGALALTPVGGASQIDPQPSPSSDGVTYPDVWPAADLTYRVSGDAVKESIMLKSRSAAASYSFLARSGTADAVLSSTGGDATSFIRSEDGALDPTTAAAAEVSLTPPMVVRADGEPQPEAGARLVSVGNKVTLSVDADWLATQPDSAFPIDLDPSQTAQKPADSVHAYKLSTEICSNSPSTCAPQFGNARDGGDTYWRSIVHFPYESLFGNTVAGVTIATGWRGGTQNAYSVHVRHASALSYAGAAYGADLASGSPGTTGSSLSGAGLTGVIQGWVNNRTSGGNLGMVGQETAGLYTYQMMDMTMTIGYYRPPSAPTGPVFATPSKACVTGASRPTIDGTVAFVLSAKVSTPDGQRVRGGFQFWNTAHTAQIGGTHYTGYVASGTVVTSSYPAKTFADKAVFAWRVLGNDGTTTGAASAWCEATVTYPPPAVPGSPAFASPVAACVTGTARPVMSSTSVIKVAMTLTDPDKNPVTASLQLYNVSTPTTLYGASISSGAAVASGTRVTLSVPANTVPDGAVFGWHAKTSNGTTTSGWSTACEGSIDNTAPPPPTICAPGTCDTWTVGILGAGRITASTDTVKYVWSTSPVSDSPNLVCGATNGTETTICVAAGGTGVFQFEPKDAYITLFAVAYDAVGHRSATQGSLPMQPVEVAPDQPAHAWATEFSADTDTAIADRGTPGLPLTLGATSSFVGDSPYGGQALSSDGTSTGASATTDRAVDPSHSFTVAATVRQSLAATGAQVFFSQTSPTTTVFSLGVDATNHYRFCAESAEQVDGSFAGDCAVSTVTPTSGNWDHVAGVWDSAAGQLRLYVGGALAASTAHASTPDLTGQVVVGCGRTAGAAADCFPGDISTPVAYTGVLDATQLADLAATGYPWDQN